MYQVLLNNGLLMRVIGEPITISGFEDIKFFICTIKHSEYEEWQVNEAITGAQIGNGLSKYEAITDAVVKLHLNGREKIINKINEFINQYGRTEIGATMMAPGEEAI